MYDEQSRYDARHAHYLSNKIKEDGLARGAEVDELPRLTHNASMGDRVAMKRLEKIGEREPAANSAAISKPTQAARKMTASPRGAASPRFTASDVARADTTATKRERDRWATVMRSEHARGRERGCVALLTASRGWTAAQILAELPSLPTDQQSASSNPVTKARSDEVWGKVYGKTSEDALSQPDAADPWAKIYAEAAEGRK